jgi:predicted nucleic acid-binding protein
VIVVDAAAVVDALIAVEGTSELRAYMAGQELHAPTLLDFEFVSAMRRLTLGGQLSVGRAEDALTDFEDLAIRRWSSSDPLRRRAFGLRDNLSAHDAAYVTLAEALECRLLTRDARLAQSSGHTAEIEVR